MRLAAVRSLASAVHLTSVRLRFYLRRGNAVLENQLGGGDGLRTFGDGSGRRLQEGAEVAEEMISATTRLANSIRNAERAAMVPIASLVNDMADTVSANIQSADPDWRHGLQQPTAPLPTVSANYQYAIVSVPVSGSFFIS